MAKNDKLSIRCKDLLAYLSNKNNKMNNMLKDLYENLKILNEEHIASPSILEESKKKALKIAREVNPNMFNALLKDHYFDRKQLLTSIEESFKSKFSFLFPSSNDFDSNKPFEDDEILGFGEPSSNDTNVVGYDAPNRLPDIPKNKSLIPCTFEEFTNALIAVKDNSVELEYLHNALDTPRLLDVVKPNKLNSAVKQYKKQIEIAFNHLSNKDIKSIVNSLQRTIGNKVTFNKAYILNEYSRRLKDKINSMANKKKPIENSKFKDKNKLNIVAGYTDDIKKRKNALKENHKFVSNKKDKKTLDIGTINQVKQELATTEGVKNFFNAKGQSVIEYIDKAFGTNVLNNFFKEFKNIKTTDLPDYVEKTNKLIEDTLFYSYFPDMKRVVEAVKTNYNLEFSPIREDKDILYEIMSDELRYYQQKNIEDKLNNMDTTFLGTSKRISKEISSIDGGGPKLTFEELHTTYVPHYAFTQNAFNSTFVIKTNKKDLPEDFIPRNITGASFLAYPAYVATELNDRNEYVVYSNLVSKFKL